MTFKISKYWKLYTPMSKWEKMEIPIPLLEKNGNTYDLGNNHKLTFYEKIIILQKRKYKLYKNCTKSFNPIDNTKPFIYSIYSRKYYVMFHVKH